MEKIIKLLQEIKDDRIPDKRWSEDLGWHIPPKDLEDILLDLTTAILAVAEKLHESTH